MGNLQASALAFNIGVHLPFEDLEGNVARIQNNVVILLEREPLSQHLLRLLAQFDNFQLPDHIRTGLAWIDHISLDFAGLDSVIDRLLPRLVLRMDSRVYY